MNDEIDVGNGMYLRPVTDPDMGRIFLTVRQVLALVGKKAKKLPPGSDEVSFAINVLVSSLAGITDQLRQADPDLHRRCVVVTINRLNTSMDEIRSILQTEGRPN